VTTPTGAAIVKTLAVGFGKIPDIEIKNTGYGAGTKNVMVDHKHHHHSYGLPNVLRVVLGREVKAATGNSNNRDNFLDKIFHTGDTIMLSTNIDDSTPEIMGYVIEKLNTSKGVLDAWLQNIYMKKNRPAYEGKL